MVLGTSLPAAQENLNIWQKRLPFPQAQGAHFFPWSGRGKLPKNGKYGVVLTNWKVGRNNLGNLRRGAKLSDDRWWYGRWYKVILFLRNCLRMYKCALERAKSRSKEVTWPGTGCWAEPEIGCWFLRLPGPVSD